MSRHQVRWVVLAVFLFVALSLARRHARATQQRLSGFQPTGSHRTAEEGDRAAVDQALPMLVPGAKSSVRYYLYFGSEAAALPAVLELQRLGFRAELLPAYKGRTPVRATESAELSHDLIDKRREWLGQIASKFGGDYDGWEVAVSPPDAG